MFVNKRGGGAGRGDRKTWKKSNYIAHKNNGKSYDPSKSYANKNAPQQSNFRPEAGASSYRDDLSQDFDDRTHKKDDDDDAKIEEDVDEDNSLLSWRQQMKENDERIDREFGFESFTHGEPRLGWLMNLRATSVEDDEGEGVQLSAIDFYFMEEDGNTFKATTTYEPYLYIGVKKGTEREIESYLRKQYADLISKVDIELKEDLDMPNHLAGLKAKYLKISFRNVQDLVSLRDVITPIIEKNSKKKGVEEAYNSSDFQNDAMEDDDEETYDNAYIRYQRIQQQSRTKVLEYTDHIIDIREYDIKYHVRAAIDQHIRVGLWYLVANDDGAITITPKIDIQLRPSPRICAFDIETTKAPLMFPDASKDEIMMISYMLDRQGYLIVNREIVSEDIEDFEYTPEPEYSGPFIVFNVADEKELLVKWFNHMKETKPSIYVTYNGDFFDWPFIDTRARRHGLNIRTEIGYWRDGANGDIYRSTYGMHLDCFYWVKRDSYLPQGSHGLKAVTKAKLQFDPIEIDPEDMLPFAREQPQRLAAYSVSDAVSTYYLYMKYVHPFIFSLCNIIPMPADDVLRKGSGTLCETLLMAKAYDDNIICPNRYKSDPEKMYKGHLLESETYIGGHVESLRSGIFREDIPNDFNLDSSAYQSLIDNLDRALTFEITVREKLRVDQVTNLQEVRDAIIQKLTAIRDTPRTNERPLIYHLDVGAMYPNIILTNRLQPSAMVNEAVCASCVHNRPESNCKRKMNWDYRAEYFKSNRSEYNTIKSQLQGETFQMNGKTKLFNELNEEEQQVIIRKRLSEYTRKVYKKVYEREGVTKEATVCQRETPFYVDCVLNFRDRRDTLKGELKGWKEKYAAAKKANNTVEIENAAGMCVVKESLQLAHKCILNSFYGYVMRKAARWYSMEMAGVVTYTGAQIIKMARELVERIGITLELDTDGIWCMLPSRFPTNFKLKLESGETRTISYPCLMLNVDVYEKFSNTQYQDLKDPEKRTYETRGPQCSIFFEVDGPYRAMVLPASKEEGKGIKKRYAVFDDAGRIAELKGFEIKRRGELKLIKVFQSQVFEQFLKGNTLEECYKHVGEVANRWLDLLYTRGEGEEMSQLFEYITESSSMSKKLSEYDPNQKSARITTAKRLAELFGDQMTKDKGLVCNYIVACKPQGAPVTERVIPVSVFQKSQAECLQFLRKWMKDTSITEVSLDDIVDWNYYIERLGSAIQKIITIPAALQNLENPVPRVVDPDWLKKKRKIQQDSHKQKSILGMLEKRPGQVLQDLEDMVGMPKAPVTAQVTRNTDKKRKRSVGVDKENDDDNVVQETYQDKMGRKKLSKIYEDPNKLLDNKFFEHDQFQAWYRSKKSQWIETRALAKRGIRRTIAPTPTGTMSSFLRQRSEQLKTSDWHVIQIRESVDKPGLIKMFVLLQDQSLHTVSIQVPKIIYVNLRKPQNETQETVRAILPRTRPSPYLFRKSIPEDVFLERSKDLNSWLYTDSNVEGVYETQVPVLFRAIMQLGSVCKVNKESQYKLEGRQPLELSDLKSCHKHVSYISEQQERTLKKIWIYESASASDSRALLGLFINATSKAVVFIIQTHADQQQVNLNRILREAKAAKSSSNEDEENEEMEEQDDTTYEFETRFVRTRHEAYMQAQSLLDSYQHEKRGPTVILTQTAASTINELERNMPILAEFPTIMMPSQERDSLYGSILGAWVSQITRVMMSRLLVVDQWYLETLNHCRYTRIPLGNNDGSDITIRMLDILYARALSRENMVLWYSDHSRPDLGGLEEDDENVLLNSASAEELFLGSGQAKCQVNNAGMYGSGFSIDFEIRHLDIDSIIQSQFVDDIEGGFATGQNQQQTFKTGAASKTNTKENLVVLDESVMCADSFRVLKSLVNQLFTDVYTIADDGNSSASAADDLLTDFYRWLSSPHSKLYDPAMIRMIQKIMRKVFLQLLAQLRKLGAKIIFANFNRILISTEKGTRSDAKHYAEYLISTIRKNKLFSWIDITPSNYWVNLLWLNEQNHSGIRSSSNTDENDPSVTLHREWNLVSYMPRQIEEDFAKFIGEYMVMLHTTKTNMQKEPLPAPTEGKKAPQDEEERFLLFNKQAVNEYLTQRLLNVVSQIQKQSELIHIDSQKLHLSVGVVDPALEFVKAFCHVFSMDPTIKEEVQIMRSNALRLVNVKDFARDAQYRNIQQTFVLPNVSCNYCSFCTDLDLCQNNRHEEEIDNLDEAQLNSSWLCKHCGDPLDRANIESRLVDYVEKKVVGYQVQDLRCIKCNSIKADNMSAKCECSGEWACKETSAAQNLNVLARIAEVENFEWLQQTLNWVLK